MLHDLDKIYRDGDKIKQAAKHQLLFAAGLGTAAVVVAGFVFVMRDSPNNTSKAFGLTFSAGLAAAGLACCMVDERTINQAKMYGAAQDDRLEIELNGAHDLAVFTQEVAQINDQLSVVAKLPRMQQIYFLEQLGLLGLAEFPEQARSAEPTNPAAIQPQTTMVLDLDGEELDLSWMTPQFAKSSKFMPAGTGSGKSNVVKWLMSQIKSDNLLLADPHLLVNQQRDKGPSWLDCTVEEEQNLVAHTTASIKKLLIKLTQEGNARLKGEGKIKGDIHLILDEADSSMIKGRDGCLAEYVEFVDSLANEFRKTGITATFITHSLKEKDIGISSATLGQFTWLILGNTAADSTVKWPGDFDNKSWEFSRSQINATLDNSKARACILREYNLGTIETSVVVMPKIESKTAETSAEVPKSVADNPAGDLFANLRKLVGANGTRQQIIDALTILQGSPPTDSALYYAISKSQIEIVDDG